MDGCSQKYFVRKEVNFVAYLKKIKNYLHSHYFCSPNKEFILVVKKTENVLHVMENAVDLEQVVYRSRKGTNPPKTEIHNPKSLVK